MHLQHGFRTSRMAIANKNKAEAQRGKASNFHRNVVVGQQRRQQLCHLLLARACRADRPGGQSAPPNLLGGLDSNSCLHYYKALRASQEAVGAPEAEKAKAHDGAVAYERIHFLPRLLRQPAPLASPQIQPLLARSISTAGSWRCACIGQSKAHDGADADGRVRLSNIFVQHRIRRVVLVLHAAVEHAHCQQRTCARFRWLTNPRYPAISVLSN